MIPGTLRRSLEHGLRAAVAVMLLAIGGAAFVQTADAERFATAAYAAAMFAVAMLAALCFAPRQQRGSSDAPSLPKLVAFSIAVGAAFAAAVSAADSPAREALVATACVLAVIASAVLPAGLIDRLYRTLTRGDAVMKGVRYTAMAVFAGWALATFGHANAVRGAVFGFFVFAAAYGLETASKRPVREIIAGTSLASIAAFALAAVAPAIAEPAAAVGYAAAVFTAGLLILRRRYA